MLNAGYLSGEHCRRVDLRIENWTDRKEIVSQPCFRLRLTFLTRQKPHGANLRCALAALAAASALLGLLCLLRREPRLLLLSRPSLRLGSGGGSSAAILPFAKSSGCRRHAIKFVLKRQFVVAPDFGVGIACGLLQGLSWARQESRDGVVDALN